MNRFALVILSAFLATEAFAQATPVAQAQTGAQAQPQPAAPATQPAVQAKTAAEANAVTMADAQKAYVSGNWKNAATAYEQVCPTLADSARTECFLWNVLALSQTGNAKDFSKAGKRLDSLIQKTNPQHPVYADLMMTKAQFQLYLGKYDNAAESLIHAIETAQPRQATVLQKVCTAVQMRVKKENLNDACQRLNNPESLGVQATDTTASAKAAQTDSVKTAEAAKQAEPVAKAAPAVQTATNTPADPAKKSEQSVPTKAVEPAKAAPQASQAAAKTVQPDTSVHWTLQLGAFGVKQNAELLVNSLKKQNVASTIVERKGETKTLFVVQSGDFATKEKAIDFGAQKLAPLNVEFRAILKK